MQEFVLRACLVAVLIRIFVVGPLCNAIRERPKLVMNLQNDTDERSDDIDGNNG